MKMSKGSGQGFGPAASIPPWVGVWMSCWVLTSSIRFGSLMALLAFPHLQKREEGSSRGRRLMVGTNRERANQHSRQ